MIEKPIENPNPVLKCEKCRKLVFKQDMRESIDEFDKIIMVCGPCLDKSQMPPGARVVAPCYQTNSKGTCRAGTYCVPCCEIMDMKAEAAICDNERQELRTKLEKMALVESQNVNELARLNKILHDIEVKYDITNREMADIDAQNEFEAIEEEWEVEELEDEIEMNQDQGENYHDR